MGISAAATVDSHRLTRLDQERELEVMRRSIVISIVAVFGFLASSCGSSTPSLSPTPTTAQTSTTVAVPAITAAAPTPTSVESSQEPKGGNFRLLISDEENAIGDFARLLVSFEGFEIERASGGWYPGTGLLIPQTSIVDLVQPQGAAAQAIWEGNVEETSYIKLRLIPADPSGVWGELAPEGGLPAELPADGDFDADLVLNGDDNCRFVPNGNGTDEDNQADADGDGIGDACAVFVELPSGRFEWEPRDTQGEHAGFTVGDVEPINFVYDLTVVRRGPPGDYDYLVQPEIGQTGSDQVFDEVAPSTTETMGPTKPTTPTQVLTPGSGESKCPATESVSVEPGDVPPNVFLGTATINGQVVPDGTNITACIDYEPVASTTTSDGTFLLTVEQKIPTLNGKTITFSVGGLDTEETGVWTQGDAVLIDLSAE